jgi:chromosome segregation ATPase
MFGFYSLEHLTESVNQINYYLEPYNLDLLNIISIFTIIQLLYLVFKYKFQIKTLSNNIIKLSNNMKVLDKKIVEQRKKYSDYKEKKENDINILNNNIVRLNAINSAYRDENSMLSGGNNDYQPNIKLIDENLKLKENNSELDKKNTELLTKILDLKTENDKVTQKVKDLKQEFKILNQDYDELDKLLSCSNDDIRLYSLENKDLKNKIKDLEQKNTELKTKNSNLNSQLNEYQINESNYNEYIHNSFVKDFYDCIANNMTVKQIKYKTTKQNYEYIKQYFANYILDKAESEIADFTEKQIYIYALIYTYIRKFRLEFEDIIGKKLFHHKQCSNWFYKNNSNSMFLVSVHDEMINKDICNIKNMRALLKLLNSNELEY